jgi:hypothetical protein
MCVRFPLRPARHIRPTPRGRGRRHGALHGPGRRRPRHYNRPLNPRLDRDRHPRCPLCGARRCGGGAPRDARALGRVGTDGAPGLGYRTSATSRSGSHAEHRTTSRPSTTAPSRSSSPALRSPRTSPSVHAPPHTDLDRSHESGVAPLHSIRRASVGAALLAISRSTHRASVTPLCAALLASAPVPVDAPRHHRRDHAPGSLGSRAPAAAAARHRPGDRPRPRQPRSPRPPHTAPPGSPRHPPRPPVAPTGTTAAARRCCPLAARRTLHSR